MSSSQTSNMPSEVIEIRNLPLNYSNLMLEQLTKAYPGVESIIEADGPGQRALIKFDTAD